MVSVVIGILEAMLRRWPIFSSALPLTINAFSFSISIFEFGF